MVERKNIFSLMQIELNYKEFGQGEPVIILHGMFGMLDNWQTIARQLSEHYLVYVIDQRDHGRSPHTDSIDYQLLAEDLKVFMESQWIYKARIVGHSMGGKAAMEFAITNPDMVEKLLIIDIAPKSYKGGHEVIIDTLLSIDLEKLIDRKDAENQIAKRVQEAGTIQFLLKNLTRNENTGAFEWKMNLANIYANYEKILGNISVGKYEGETLFVRGAESNYILEGDEKIIQDFFPKSIIKTIQNAGHWVHAEQPKALLEMILAFL
jgi:esterase